MKKTLLAFLLALCMVICLGAVAVSAAEETDTQATEHVDHCVCGGNAEGVGNHTTCETIVYTPISEALTTAGVTTQTVDFGLLPSGNYYLDEDIHVTAATSISGSKTINLCLNGHNITTASDKRTIQNIKMGCTVSFCDCQGELVDGAWVGGSIVAGKSTYGAFTYTHAGSVLNIYGGAFRYGQTAAPRYGGLIVVAMDAGTDITGDSTYNSSDYSGKNLSYLNMYNGELSGGTASRGGNVYLMHAGIMNMYGGVISGGTAVYSVNGTSKYPARGGNLYADASTVFNMSGGTITGGTAAKYSVDNTADNAQGGNIYSTGTVNISGGTICNGYAEHNPYATSTTAWGTSTPGRGGNIYMTGSKAKLTITGGSIYDGKANGIGGGNIWFQTGTFNMSGGKIWGGVANADQNEAGTDYLRYAYDICGGSIRIESGTFNMTGGTIGIDADGNAAGGTTYPSGSEAGNLYVQGTANLSGGVIANGYSRGKGGNLGGSGTITVSGSMVIRDGKADTHGGNWTIYNNGKCTISGGTISGGYAARMGGNIMIDGNNTTAHALTITGGTITGGTSVGNGGNIRISHASKILNISGSAVISDGVSTDDHGGNICAVGAVNISGSAVISGGSATAGAGGNIYVTADASLSITESAQVKDGDAAASNAGNIFTACETTLADSVVVSGGKALAGNGGNIYMTSAASLTVSGSVQIKDGTSKNAGGNIYAKGDVTLADDVVVSGGTVNSSSSGNIYISGATLTISGNATVSNGTSKKEGGNISNYGTVIIQNNASITGGSAGTVGGNIYNGSGKTLTITGGTISGGTATEEGGCIYNLGTLTLENAKISAGTASHGGNLYLAGGTSTISGITVSDGKANLTSDGTPQGCGGNIYIAEDLAITLTNCTISGGTAVYQGGSIYNYGDLTVTGGSITGGTADAEVEVTTSGGNIYSVGSVTIDGATVSGGSATHGGNITLSAGTNLIQNATISDGKANLMTDGTTNGNGGNIYSTGNATTTITGCTITGGEARRAGSVGAWGKVTIEDTTITGGYAYYNGGNIMTYGNGQLTLNDGTVLSEGEARNGGGAISFSSNAGKKQVINTGAQIYSGTAPASSACIYLGGGDLNLVGSPYIQQIAINSDSTTQTLTAGELTVDSPIEVTVLASGDFAISDTDKSACFVNNQGYTIAYRSGYLYMDAPTAVYVSDNGSDSNLGTQSAPYLTMDHAMDMVAENGTVTIVDKVTLTAWDRHEKSAVLTGGELDLTTSDRLEMGDSIHFKAMTMTMPTGDYFIYCNGFKTVIDEDVTVRYYDGTTYTTDSTTSYLYGGSRSSYVTEHGAITGTDLTVLSGVWGYVYGGNNTVDMTGDVHLTVGGKIDYGVDYVSHTKSSNYLILGGSRNANIYGTIYMNVTAGTTGTSIHGGSSGACHVDNIELRVTGGDGMAIYGAGRGGAQTVGTVNFYYEGGTFEQVFGGVLSNLLTGDVNLYVTGGNITRRVYGGCYSNCDESSGNWTADNYVTGDVNLIIGSGANISCDLEDPDAGWESLITGGLYADRGIYGHSRREAPGSSDAENATIIFLDQTAYNNNKGNLTAQDTIMSSIMNGVSAADLICYLSWSADDTADVIYANATAVADPETGTTGDASAISAQAALALSDTQFYYTGQAIKPATVTYSDNWLYGDAALTYANNTEIGTATASAAVNGYTVSSQFTIVKKDDVAQVIVGNTVTAYGWLQDAVNAVPEGGYLKLVAGSDENVTVSKDLYLDLAGFSMTGTVTVADGATLYGMDSTTDDYDCSDGNGTIKVTGNVEVHHKTAVTGKVRRYLTYTETDGTLSFHRIYLGITSMSLRPSVVGVGYKAAFRADSKALTMLDENEAFGYRLWILDAENNEVGTATRYLERAKFTNKGTVTLRLQSFDVENYGEHQVCAEVYLKLADGTVIDSSDYTYTLRSMLESIAKDTSGYSDSQMSALKAMCEKFESVVSGWANMDNILNWVSASA